MRGVRTVPVCGLVFLMFLSLMASAAEPSTPASLSRLPIAAQSSISEAMGRNASQYLARVRRDGFVVENPQHRLEVDFTAAGVTLRQATANWGIRLSGYGYGNAVKTVKPTFPRASANRVVYRCGAITEWYVNGPMGLEQGFTLNRRPGRGQGQPVTIELSLSGNMIAADDGSHSGLILIQPDGKTELRYAGLSAYDATGQEKQSSLEIRGNRLLLHVDDAGARYPIVVDPTIQLGKLGASDGQSFDWFGYSVSMSGSTVVIGAPQASVGTNRSQGAAYVFVKPTAGWTTMTQTAKLTASDGAAADYFGGAVAISGNTVVVGAMDATVNNSRGQGAAYVYVMPTGGWVTTSQFTAKLTASDGGANDFLGDSVAISGSTVVLGAPHREVGSNFDQGAAYVYVQPVSGWTSMTETARLTSGDGVRGDQFAQSLAIDGSTIVAGAPYAAVAGDFVRGAAYVFVQPVGGWVNATQTAKLTAAGGLAQDFFGGSVGISGNTVAVGAPGVNSYRGAAYVFVQPTGGWKDMNQNAKLTTSDGAANDLFGISVSVSGNSVLAGASHATINSNQWQGKSYLFVKPAGGWINATQSSRFSAAHGTAMDNFGASVSLSGNNMVMGAYYAPAGANSAAGAAYVFGPSGALKKLF